MNDSQARGELAVAGEGEEDARARQRQGADAAFDPKVEKFVGDPEADALLTREYRAPFVVPDKV